jgi:nitroreductase
MDTIKTIHERRSIRKYSNKPIADDIVKELLSAGMHAPTARNLQPWHYIVINERHILDELAVVHPYAKMLNQATLAILVCGDRTIQAMDGYIIQDCSAATQNILLAAHAHGLGAVWLGMYPREQRIKDVAKLLSIPDHILPVSLISIGYPNEARQTPQRYKTDRIHFNKF